MGLCVLFGLLLGCLACFREGVWAKYTPRDVARWHAQAAKAAVAGEALFTAPSAPPSGPAAGVGQAADPRREAREERVAEMVG